MKKQQIPAVCLQWSTSCSAVFQMPTLDISRNALLLLFLLLDRTAVHSNGATSATSLSITSQAQNDTDQEEPCFIFLGEQCED